MGSTDCGVDGCEREARKAGLCWAHAKRRQNGQDANVLARPSGVERLTEAALRYAAAEDDDDFERAKDNLRKAAAAASHAALAELAAAGRRRARAAGVKFGRPPKVDLEQVRQLLPLVGSARALAERLAVSEATAYRLRAALAKVRSSESA